MSWDEYKKKREQESSWAKYKKQRDYEKQQKEQAQIEQNKLLEKLNLPTKEVKSNQTVVAPNANSKNNNMTNVRNSMATSLNQQFSKATTTKNKGIVTSVDDIINRIKADEKNKNIAKGGEDAFNEYMDSTLNAIPGGAMSVFSGIANAGTSLAGAGVKGLQNLTNNENVEEKLQETYDKIINIGKNINQKGNSTNLVNSYVDNDFTRESSNVVHTISSQLTTYGLSLATGIPAPVIQGTYIGGASAQEVLNENKDNAGRAVLTGVGKGLTSYGVEKLTGGNILGKGSFDDMAVGFIANNFSSKAGQKIASKIYEVGGEVIEENLENALDMVIDNVVNQKGYTVKDWWNELGETSKGTVLATIALNLLGLGGDTYNKVQQYKLDSQAKKMIKEAEMLIEKENLKIDFDKIKQNNKNTDTNIQPQSIQNAQNTPSQQVMPIQQEKAQNRISEQVVKRNIIDEKVNQYINQNRNNFNSNINLSTDIVNKSNETPINYKVQNQGTIYKKARELFSKVNKKVFKNANQDIYVTNGDIRESIEKTLKNPEQRKQINENLAVFSQLDKIIENGQKISSSELDNKGRNEYADYEYYVSNAYIDGKPYVVEFDTRLQKGESRKQERHFRLERVYNINEVGSKTGATEVTSQIGIEPTSIITNSIPQNTKNVNGNTTSNYSMQESENNSGSFNLPPNKILNPTEISNIKPSNASTTPKLPNVNYGKGNKQSSFFANVVTDAKFLEQELRQQLSQEDNIRYYKGITNKDTLEKAFDSLNKEGEKATLTWMNKDAKNIKAEDVAKGWILLKQYQDAGDYQGAVEIAKKMREMATGAGQTVQAYNILSRLTPEGMFYYAQSELSEAYNKMVEGKSQKWIEENKDKFELTPTETQFIMDTMKDVSNMEDGYDKKVKLAEIQSMLKNKIPPTAGQSVKAWMRMSMLFNPKTQVRNILGNAVVLPVNVGGDIIASSVDKIISKKTGVRTTGNVNIKNYSKGFGKGLYESYNDFRKGINTRNIEGNRFEVSEGKSFKDKGIGKALNRVDNILSFMLDAGDRGFYEATFTNSINNQLVLNNTTEVTQDMIDIATNEALQRTWQDNNKYTEAVLKIRNILNYANVKGYGLGDVIIPFAKTPANLTKAIVDYSPAGLVKAITLDAKTFKNSLENGQYTPQMQHKLVQNIGKGMAGSFLYVLGYALAKAGIASGEADDDKDVKNFMKNSLGISSYSIKIGDKTFTYDWAQPIATPLAIMTNYVKYSEENSDASIIDKAIKSLNIGTEQLLQQSFMESLNTVLNGNGTTLENLSQAILELPARAIPTLSKQIADMVDGTQRTSFEYDKPMQSAVNSVIAKLPVASKSLPVARDTLGNEIKKYGGENNVFNVMFNPANVNKGQLSKAGEEIYRLYQETGETTVFPITAPYYINSKGEKITMTAEERSNYQKVTGEYAEKSIEELLSNVDYKKLSNEKKAELITDIISDSNAKAKYDILNIETDAAQKKRKLIEKIGTKNYYDYRFKTKDIEGKNATRKKNEVLLNANYSNKVKDILYTNTTGKDDNLYNILSNGNININEYLDYKIRDSKDEFASDKNSDGETISGSSKKKVYSYVNNNITGVGNRLIILGNQYKLKDNERKALSEYINKIIPKTKDRIEVYKKLTKNFVVKDGKVYYK